MLFRLMDYDGMWVPALAGTPPSEVGHPNYQHPQRLREGGYGPEIDRFAHLVIYTALRCLIVGGKALWTAHDNDENVLFREADFKNPGQSKLFPKLLALPEAGVVGLVGRLLLASQGPIAQTPLAGDLIAGGDAAPLSREEMDRIRHLIPSARFSQSDAPPSLPSSGRRSVLRRSSAELEHLPEVVRIPSAPATSRCGVAAAVLEAPPAEAKTKESPLFSPPPLPKQVLPAARSAPPSLTWAPPPDWLLRLGLANDGVIVRFWPAALGAVLVRRSFCWWSG